VVERRIVTEDAAPVRKAPYSIPFALMEEVDREVQKMLDQGVIRPSHSPWQSPVTLVPKKSESAKPRYRICVDYRQVNAMTKYNSYPLPRYEDTVSTLAGCKWFSKVDLYSGFWQINICESDREKTALLVHNCGHYEFNCLPYGMANSPSSFQRLMDIVLKNLKGSECWVFMGDVIIFSDTVQEHATCLANVFEKFNKANLQLQLEKCDFSKDRVVYLSFVLSQKGIESADDKIRAVQQYPVPKSVKEVRAFLGLYSSYRRLVPHFADIAKPLTELTKKDQIWQWSSECQKAFEGLKHKLSNPPVLAFSDMSLPFILSTDASQVGIGAILFQIQDGIERRIAYASRQLSKSERSYSASELEALAVIWAN
jgi:hypothetical protein